VVLNDIEVRKAGATIALTIGVITSFFWYWQAWDGLVLWYIFIAIWVAGLVGHLWKEYPKRRSFVGWIGFFIFIGFLAASPDFIPDFVTYGILLGIFSGWLATTNRK
jgi:hypothetical protein